MYFRAKGLTKEQNKVIPSELPILYYMSLEENVYMTPYPAGAGAAEAGTATGGCG